MSYRKKQRVPQELHRLEEDRWVYLQEASEMMGCTRQTMVRHIRKFGLKSKQANPMSNSPILVSYNAIVDFSQCGDYAARWHRGKKETETKEEKE